MHLRLVAARLRSLGAPATTLLHLRRGLVHLRWLVAEFDARYMLLRHVTVIDLPAVL